MGIKISQHNFKLRKWQKLMILNEMMENAWKHSVKFLFSIPISFNLIFSSPYVWRYFFLAQSNSRVLLTGLK